MDDIDKKIVQDTAKERPVIFKEHSRKYLFVFACCFPPELKSWSGKKIITGYHASVDPMKLGYHIIAFVNLDVFTGR